MQLIFRLSSQFSDIDECASSPCIHGTCQDAINNFTCTCDEGFTSTLCDQGILFFLLEYANMN